MRPVEDLPFIEWSPKAGGKIRVYADAWETDDLDIPTTATTHPLEDGARRGDGIRNEPITIKCRMFFSEVPIRGDLDPTYHPGVVAAYPLPVLTYPDNTPLLSPGGLQKVVTGAVTSIANAITGGGSTGPTMVSALQFASAPGRLRETLGKILQVREEKGLFTVGCSVLLLRDMCMLNAHISRSSEDGDSGAIDFEFQQMQFVSTETAAALPLPSEPRGQIKKSGKAGTGDKVPEGPVKTGAAAIVDSITG